MISQDIIFLLRETACRFVFRQALTSKDSSQCYLNPPCGCANPGKELQCEECPHLEACLSRFRTFSVEGSQSKIGRPATT